MCHLVSLQTTSLEDKLKYSISAELNESTAIQLEVMTIVHLNEFRTPKIGLTGMETWTIKIIEMTTGSETINMS